MRKISITISLATLAFLVSVYFGIRCYVLGSQRYWKDFVGLSDDEVIQKLGVSMYCSEKDLAIRKKAGSYVFVYKFGDGFKLWLTFSNNVVISQGRGSH